MNYQTFFVVLTCLWAIFIEECAAVRLSNFEDFLMNHNQDSESTTPPPTEPQYSGDDYGSGDSMNFLEMTTTTNVPTTLPRTRMTCCELGKLAGQNNFHCNPNNYGPQMEERNNNRAPFGNFKRNQPSKTHAFTQVKQFSKCISGQVRELAWDFQSCCKHAYREQLNQQRRDEMILEVPIDVHENNKPSRRIFHIERDETDTHRVPSILGVELAEEEPQRDSRTSSRYQKKPSNRRSW